MDILYLAFAFAIMILWHRLRQLEKKTEREASYAEWWLRSMENRKQDREWMKHPDETGDE